MTVCQTTLDEEHLESFTQDFDMKAAISLAIGLLVFTVQVSATTKYVCKSLFYVGRDPTDCSKWFACIFGFPTRRYCAAETVFSLKHLVCVHKGSVYDDCPVTGKNDFLRCLFVFTFVNLLSSIETSSVNISILIGTLIMQLL